MGSDFHSRGQSLVGIIVVLVIVGVITGGLYLYLSKQIPEITEITEKPTEEAVKPEKEITLIPKEELPGKEVPSEEEPLEAPKEERPKITCQNECSQTGLKRCSVGGYQTCENYDTDDCLEWSSVTNCPSNTVCQNGACIPIREETSCLESGICVNDNILLIIQEDGDPFVTYNEESEGTTVDREITKFYSQNVDKETDFLVVFTDFSNRYYYPRYARPIKRNISGINKTPLDQSATYGTNNLQSFILMSDIRKLGRPGYLEDSLVILAHEVGHTWMFYLDDPSLYLADRSIYAEQKIHIWSCFYPASEGYIDIMGIYTWEQIDQNTFASYITPSPRKTEDFKFSPLSLYLMGLVPKESVPSMYWIERFDGSDGSDEDCGSAGKGVATKNITITGTKRAVTINDIIATYGERVPSYANSQKEFKIQFALLVHEDTNITQEDVYGLQEFINEFPTYFNFATHGKANIRVVSYPN